MSRLMMRLTMHWHRRRAANGMRSSMNLQPGANRLGDVQQGFMFMHLPGTGPDRKRFEALVERGGRP